MSEFSFLKNLNDTLKDATPATPKPTISETEYLVYNIVNETDAVKKIGIPTKYVEEFDEFIAKSSISEIESNLTRFEAIDIN